MKYEYVVRELDANFPSERDGVIPKVAVSEMNDLGKQGYELVSAIPYGRGVGTVRIVFIYKRGIAV